MIIRVGRNCLSESARYNTVEKLASHFQMKMCKMLARSVTPKCERYDAKQPCEELKTLSGVAAPNIIEPM